MKFSTVALPIALAATGMMQPAQADIGRGISLATQFFTEGVASLGAEIAGRSKRSTGGFITKARQARPPTAPEGVPQQEFDRCYTDITGVRITATSPGAGCKLRLILYFWRFYTDFCLAVQFDNVPASCMNLATVLVGDPVNGPYPTPCGSACLVYNGLSDQQYNDLVGALNAVAT